MFLSLLNSLLWLMKPDSGAGDGGSSGDSTTGPNSGDTPSADTSKREIPANWKAMSAEDFNTRLEKEQRSATRKALKDLGFADEDLDTPEKLGAALQKASELMTFAHEQRRAQMTAAEQVQADLETAQQTATTERQKREQAEAERDTAQQQLREFILRSTITAAAQGAAHPSDVYDLFARMHMKDKLAEVIRPDVALFTEDGAFNVDAIDPEAVKAIVEQCRKDRREWWQGGYRAPGSPSHGGAQPPAQDPSKLDQMTDAGRRNIRQAMR